MKKLLVLLLILGLVLAGCASEEAVVEPAAEETYIELSVSVPDDIVVVTDVEGNITSNLPNNWANADIWADGNLSGTDWLNADQIYAPYRVDYDEARRFGIGMQCAEKTKIYASGSGSDCSEAWLTRKQYIDYLGAKTEENGKTIELLRDVIARSLIRELDRTDLSTDATFPSADIDSITPIELERNTIWSELPLGYDGYLSATWEDGPGEGNMTVIWKNVPDGDSMTVIWENVPDDGNCTIIWKDTIPRTVEGRCSSFEAKE